jgi:DNA-binding IclR family transcriptional regulator
MTALHRRGFVAKAARGEYLPGPALLRGRGCDLNTLLREVSRPALARLARETGLTAHLGVFEGDMVTYLVKAPGRTPVLTQEGVQLEAYCSGIGKVLLAALPEPEQDRYLSVGGFVRLTANTIIDPEALRRALQDIRREGRAVDDGEVIPELRCLAVPVRDDQGAVCAAISVSATVGADGEAPIEDYLEQLGGAARRIEHALRGPDG